MNLPITGSFRWSQDEYVRAQLLSIRNSSSGRKFLLTMRVIGLACLAVGLVVYLLGSTAPLELVVPALVGGAFLAVPLFAEQWARKRYAKRPDRDLLINLEIRDDYMVARADSGNVKTMWSSVQAVVHVPQGFLLYPRDESFQWIPTAAFTDLGEQFAELAGTKVRNFTRVR